MLARALARQLGARRFSLHALPDEGDIRAALAAGECVLVDGDLPRAAERQSLLALGEAAERVLVEWRCSRPEAEREIFHRYAARPHVLAECERAHFEADLLVREPAAESEGARVLLVGAGAPLGDQVIQVTAAVLPRPAVEGPDRSRRGVLVVEDDAEERAVLAEVLHELGYDVELAPDAGVALALLEDERAHPHGARIELVLSDQRMPGMTGIELARILAAEHPEIRSVLLTAYGDEPTCRDAIAAQAVAVLEKPVHVIDLQRVLEEAEASAEAS
ncbi:MAG TPA: response regulator [Polyangia bacterium]